MPEDRTVLDHLLEGREQLRQEVDRLTEAIAELDAVIAQIGGAGRRVAPMGEVVSRGIELPSGGAAPLRTGRPAAKRAFVGRAPTSDGEHPKSIRVHVLEMLAAEDRDFGLTEIIDNIRAAGIQAHDDAVRSITVKLMKDGSVERVGRGQYRLAGRGDRSATVTTGESGFEPVSELDPEGETRFEPEPEAETYTPPLNLGQAWE